MSGQIAIASAISSAQSTPHPPVPVSPVSVAASSPTHDWNAERSDPGIARDCGRLARVEPIEARPQIDRLRLAGLGLRRGNFRVALLWALVDLGATKAQASRHASVVASPVSLVRPASVLVTSLAVASVVAAWLAGVLVTVARRRALDRVGVRVVDHAGVGVRVALVAGIIAALQWWIGSGASGG